MAEMAREENAFTIDEDEDMNALLEQAANAGSAAVDEDHDSDDLSAIFAVNNPVTAPVAVTPPPPPPVEEVHEPITVDELDELDWDDVAVPDDEPVDLPVETVEAAEESSFDLVDDEDIFQTPQPIETAPQPTIEPEISSADDLRRELEEVQREAKRSSQEDSPIFQELNKDKALDSDMSAQESVTAHQSTSARATIVRQTEPEQIARAAAVIATLDELRKLSAEVRSVVAQLISQDDSIIDDEAAIIIKAINADTLTFETMAALKEAKTHEPVDRAFFILALPDEVRRSLGSLVSAFSGEEFNMSDNLSFSRALVNAIHALDDQVIGYVKATEAVLKAAKES